MPSLRKEEKVYSDMFLKCLFTWYNILIFLSKESKIVYETYIHKKKRANHRFISIHLK